MSVQRYPARQPSVTLQLTFETENPPLLRDITSILYGLELLHDFVTLATSERHQGYEFDDRFFHRSARPIESEELLCVSNVSHGSNLEVALEVVPLSALATVLVIMERISFWKLDRAKLKSEIEKLRRNVDRLDFSDRELIGKFERAAASDEGEKIVRGILGGMETIADRMRLTAVAFRV